MSRAWRICELDGIIHLPSMRELLVRYWRPARSAWPMSMLTNPPTISPPVYWHATEHSSGWTMRVNVGPADIPGSLDYYSNEQVIKSIDVAHHPWHGTVSVSGHHIWATSEGAWTAFNAAFPLLPLAQCIA